MFGEPQHLTDRLTRTAADLGVVLPEPVRAALDLRAGLPPLESIRSEVASAIARAFGSDDYAEVRDAALDRLARAEAARHVRTPIEGSLASLRWRVIREHSEEIVELFREALAESLEELNTHAPTVPPETTRESLATLPAPVFAAHGRVMRAAASAVQAAAALAPFYGPGLSEVPAIWHRQALVALPTDPMPRDDARRVAFGLNGQRLIQGAEGMRRRPADWPFVVGNVAGVRFDLVSPSAFAATTVRLDDAAEPEPGPLTVQRAGEAPISALPALV